MATSDDLLRLANGEAAQAEECVRIAGLLEGTVAGLPERLDGPLGLLDPAVWESPTASERRAEVLALRERLAAAQQAVIGTAAALRRRAAAHDAAVEAYRWEATLAQAAEEAVLGEGAS